MAITKFHSFTRTIQKWLHGPILDSDVLQHIGRNLIESFLPLSDSFQGACPSTFISIKRKTYRSSS